MHVIFVFDQKYPFVSWLYSKRDDALDRQQRMEYGWGIPCCVWSFDHLGNSHEPGDRNGTFF